MQQRRLGEASSWAPWLATLPTTFPHTVFWPDESLAELEGSFTVSGTLERKQLIKDGWERIRRHCHPDDTAEDFMWAHCAVASRSFDAGDRSRSMLAPLSDLFNHSATAAVTYGPGEGGAFQFVFTRDVEAGEEVEITYGLYSNRKLLQQYGFAMHQNPDDKVKFCLNFSPEAPGFVSKRQCLKRLALTREDQWLHPIAFDSDGVLVGRREGTNVPQEPLDPCLMAALRIQVHNAEEDPPLEGLTRDMAEAGFAARNEAEACYTLLTLIQALLDRYPTEYEADVAELQRADLVEATDLAASRKRAALVLRVGEKQILQQNAAYVQKRLDAAMEAWQGQGGAGGLESESVKRRPRSRGGRKKKKP